MTKQNETKGQGKVRRHFATGSRRAFAVALAALAIPLSACTIGQTRIAFGVGLAADLGTTQSGMNSGATEANPTLKSNPMLLAAAGSVIFSALAEYLSHNGHGDTARWLYGAGAVLHGGAALWNSGQSGNGTTTRTAVATTTSASMGFRSPVLGSRGFNIKGTGKGLGVRVR